MRVMIHQYFMSKDYSKEERKRKTRILALGTEAVGASRPTLCPSQSSLMVSIGRGSLSAFRSVITSYSEREKKKILLTLSALLQIVSVQGSLSVPP